MSRPGSLPFTASRAKSRSRTGCWLGLLKGTHDMNVIGTKTNRDLCAKFHPNRSKGKVNVLIAREHFET